MTRYRARSSGRYKAHTLRPPVAFRYVSLTGTHSSGWKLSAFTYTNNFPSPGRGYVLNVHLGRRVLVFEIIVRARGPR